MAGFRVGVAELPVNVSHAPTAALYAPTCPDWAAHNRFEQSGQTREV